MKCYSLTKTLYKHADVCRLTPSGCSSDMLVISYINKQGSDSGLRQTSIGCDWKLKPIEKLDVSLAIYKCEYVIRAMSYLKTQVFDFRELPPRNQQNSCKQRACDNRRTGWLFSFTFNPLQGVRAKNLS